VSLTRDFLLFSQAPEFSMGPFRITKILRDNRNFVFIADVSDTNNKLFTSENDTGDKLSPVSLL
jgi:hypothetical protein